MTDKILLPDGAEIPCDAGNVSDGYHTFNELYAHRCAQFGILMLLNRDIAWKSRLHDDGSSYEGWFIAGIDLPVGPVTYHLPESLWPLLARVRELERAPKWDGHTPADVLDRLKLWAKQL